MAKTEKESKHLSFETNCLSVLNKADFLLSSEEIVSDNEHYVLSVCGTNCNGEFRIGAALSDQSCIVYSVGESITEIAKLEHNKFPIVGVKFSPSSKNVLYMASEDGNVMVCDLRAKGKVVAEFKGNNDESKLKPLSSFDINNDETLLASGTEHIGGDAFILFWDIRLTNSKISSQNNLLGGYWDSHMDDVTCLAFHPNKKDVLASGSTDGLINIFDLKQSSEDLALTFSLNTESSVDRIGWLKDDNIWCTTHTHDLQLWNCDDALPYDKYNRKDLSFLQTDDIESCYLVRIHVPSDFKNPFLLAGSSSAKGEVLQCLGISKGHLEPRCLMTGNKQIVRDSWLHEQSGCLITGGENGILNVWRQTTPTFVQMNTNKRTSKLGAEKRSDKNYRTKPY